MVTNKNSSAAIEYAASVPLELLTNLARLTTSSTPSALINDVSFCNPMKSFSSGGITRRTA